MSAITTHILDLSSGRPAVGVAVALEVRRDESRWDGLASGATDADGRLRDLLPEAMPLEAGTYRLRFQAGRYFLDLGVRSFHPSIVVEFAVDDPAGHYHIPLLLSPFGYSTYRGS
jgi:5-hydroxyisourate hydrolase